MKRQDYSNKMVGSLFGYIATGILLTNFACISTVHAREVGSESKASPLREKDDGDITARLQRIDRKFSQIGPLIRIIQEKLPSLVEQVKELEDPGIKETVGKLSEEHAALQKKTEQLVNQIDELKRALESKQREIPQQSIQQMEKMLAEAEQERNRLEEKLNQLNSAEKGTSEDSEGCRDDRPFPRDKRSVYVVIYKGRIAPMDEPYYNSRQGYIRENGKLIPAVEKKRVREGEPISQAIKAGGCLDKLLSNLNPDKEYVNFQVCKDSIGAFYLAVEEARRRKIPYSWEPEKDRTFIFFSRSYTGSGVRTDWGWNPK